MQLLTTFPCNVHLVKTIFANNVDKNKLALSCNLILVHVVCLLYFISIFRMNLSIIMRVFDNNQGRAYQWQEFFKIIVKIFTCKICINIFLGSEGPIIRKKVQKVERTPQDNPWLG